MCKVWAVIYGEHKHTWIFLGFVPKLLALVMTHSEGKPFIVVTRTSALKGRFPSPLVLQHLSTDGCSLTFSASLRQQMKLNIPNRDVNRTNVVTHCTITSCKFLTIFVLNLSVGSSSKGISFKEAKILAIMTAKKDYLYSHGEMERVLTSPLMAGAFCPLMFRLTFTDGGNFVTGGHPPFFRWWRSKAAIGTNRESPKSKISTVSWIWGIKRRPVNDIYFTALLLG